MHTIDDLNILYNEDMKEKYDKIKYNNKWRDDNYKRFELIVSKKDQEVIDKLSSVPSKSSYIVELIKKDLKKASN